MNAALIRLVTGCTLAITALVPTAAFAQQEALDPVIHDGERLVYTVRSSRFGNIGTATMRVDADTAGGRDAWRLSFDFSARVMLFKVSDRTRSWLDAGTLTTLRYSKTERSPVGSFDEDVRILPGAGQWTDGRRTFELGSPLPLDELAFIYFVRAAAHAVGDGGMTVERHFDADRNPVQLHARGHTRVYALGDSLIARVIQMDARDARQKNGTTRMMFYIGEGRASLPLRIDTSMPVAGSMTMTLQRVEPGRRVGERSTAMSRVGAEGSAASGQN